MMDVSILHMTSENRGDHAADLAIAVAVRDGETVTQLAERILNGSHYDHIEIRLVKP